MASKLSSEISATCNALGHFDEKTNKYYADSNTLETVKDLIRYLRRDDEHHTVRRQLGDTKVLITDLLPLLKHYHEENDLFDVLLRLIMNLTTPPLLLFNFEIPKFMILRNLYMELEDHLKSYKEAFVDEGIWAVFSTHLSKVLDVDNAERGDENSVKIERVLVLIRNILFVPADSIEKRPDNDASVHDQVLWALHHSGLLDIILYITTNPAEQGYYMYILEIMYFMFKGQKSKELAIAALQRSQGEKIRDEAELVRMRDSDLSQKQMKIKQYTGARHSRFGGTFVVKSIKSITDNELIVHKPLNQIKTVDFDSNKSRKKIAKNRAPLKISTIDRRSAFTIRLFLKEFCIEFLNGAYNSMMHYVKSVLVRHGGENHDESYYFWALTFFMSFNRLYKFEVKLVSETLSVQVFHFVQQHTETYLELMKTDKSKILIWSSRLHIALLSYKELLSTLFVMNNSKDQVVKDSSKVIMSNVFYVPEYREFILTLLIMYDELKMTDVYLLDLMETQHLFFKMFESYCKSEGSVMVKKKSNSKRRKKAANPRPNVATELDLDEMWDGVSPQLSAILESGGDFLTDAVPFDAASDVPIDEQKTMAMKNIQYKLRHSEFETAIGIMRAAREVWPENNSFGSDNMTTEEEFLSLREIFYADFGENTIVNNFEQFDDEYDEEEEDDEPTGEEVNFDFSDFLNRLPHHKIIKACGRALRTFETNSVNTNHSILKLMHRIAFDCKYYVMLFQLNIFRTFQKIFSLKHLPEHKELVKFAKFIISKFFKVLEINDKVLIETLFPIQKKEAYEIEHGYGSIDKSTAKVWTDEEENELKTLFEEHKNKEIREDVVDWILMNIIKQTRTRRMVLRKLKEMELLEDKKFTKSNRTNVPYWTAEEETQLRELYSEFKDSPDPLGAIMNALTIRRPKNKVIDKLLTLGLIDHKNELKKKTQRKRKQDKKQRTVSSSSDSDEPTTTNIPQQSKQIKQKKKLAVTSDKKVIVKNLLNNINLGKQEALNWLKESIYDIIEDFEEEHEGVPLVPLEDYAANAMEDKDFQRLLTSLGFSEPFDEQEQYWRIPSHISLDVLKSHHELIISALDNNLTEDIEPENDLLSENSLVNDNIDDNTEPDPQLQIPDSENCNENFQNSAGTQNQSDDDEAIMSNLNRNKPGSESGSSIFKRTTHNQNTFQSSDDDEAVTSNVKRNRPDSEGGSPIFKRSTQNQNILQSSDDDDQEVTSNLKRTRSGSESDSSSVKRNRIND